MKNKLRFVIVTIISITILYSLNIGYNVIRDKRTKHLIGPEAAATYQRIDRNTFTIILPIVNRDLSQEKMLRSLMRTRDNWGDTQSYELPRGGTGIQRNIKVTFFKFSYDADWRTIYKEFRKRGLKPDPWVQATVNATYPGLSDHHRNAAYFPDKTNKYWISFACHRFGSNEGVDPDDERRFELAYRNRDFNPGWWFAGIAIDK